MRSMTRVGRNMGGVSPAGGANVALTAPSGQGGRAGSPAWSVSPVREVRYPDTSGSWLPGTNTSGMSSAFIR